MLRVAESARGHIRSHAWTAGQLQLATQTASARRRSLMVCSRPGIQARGGLLGTRWQSRS